jgi:hypothetical protein
VFINLLPGNDTFVAIRCSGTVIFEPLLSNGRLLRLHHSGFQPSCHKTYDKSVLFVLILIDTAYVFYSTLLNRNQPVS